MQLDPALGRNEPDYEIRELIQASAGLNLGMDYLPGSAMFDPAAGDRVQPDLASQTVWFDSFVMNVDRTVRNPNLLWWHRAPYLIDHGAALYFHHNWSTARDTAASPFAPVRDHLLLGAATGVQEAATRMRSQLGAPVFDRVLSLVPGEWFAPEGGRSEYREWLEQRLQSSDTFVEEAIRARSALL